MKIFKHLKPYWFKIVIVIITLFLNVLGVLFIPRLTVSIIDYGVANGDIPYILRQGGIMLLVAFLSSLFMVISVKNSTEIAASFAADLRKLVFVKVQGISISQYEQFGAASLIVRSTDDITQVQTLTRMGLRMMLRAPLMFIGGIIMAISTNLELSMVFLASLPITMIAIGFFAVKLVPIVGRVRLGLDNINKIFRQRLNGIKVIRAFDKEIYEEGVFDKYNKEYTDVFDLAGRYQALFGPMLSFIMNITLVAIIYFGSRLIMTGSMRIGEIVGFLQYANSIMMSFLFLSMIFIQIPRAQASINRINDVLNLKEDILEDGDEILEDIQTLEFKNVCFKYPSSKNYALKDVSFKAKKGDIVGVIGSTGSGKTTLANLLVRFYDIDEGEILINGINIKNYDIHSLRDNIGYTEQKPSLIAGTVHDNVSMGMDQRDTLNMEDALEIAQADFILERETGIHSDVAQRGGNFSGGQKQRISIARAVYKNPSLYLIDDSFSALDYKTEKELRKKLYSEIKDNIMIVITQRATVAHDSDTIVLLNNGEMIGIGNHEELKEQSLEYREILESQDFEAGKNYGT